MTNNNPNGTPSLEGLRKAGLGTISVALVATEIVKRETAGDPHTMSSLATTLDMPVSTISRLIFDVSQLGFVRYEAVPGDRRKKLLRANVKKFWKAVAE